MRTTEAATVKWNFRTGVVAALLGLTAASGQAETTINLPNAGFEDGLANWITTADNNMSAAVAEAAHAGKLGLRVKDASAEKASGLASTRFAASAGEEYNLKFWARAVSGLGITVYLRFYSADGTMLTTREDTTEIFVRIFPSDTEWKEVSCTGRAPAGSTQGEIWIQSSRDGQVVADFDDFVLTTTGAAPTGAIPVGRVVGATGAPVLPAAPAAASAAPGLLDNAGFEDGTKGWSFWMPPEEKDKNNRFAVVTTGAHGGQSCALLEAAAFSYSVMNSGRQVPVKGGEHYRVTVWVRADEGVQLQAGKPGAVVAVAFFDAAKTRLPARFLFSLNGKTVPDNKIKLIANPLLPQDWTRLQGVIEVPADAAAMVVGMQQRGMIGRLYWDDVQVERVGADVPLSPWLGDTPLSGK